MFSSDSFSRRTRVSAHFIDAAPAEGELVTVEGWVTSYDEKDKSWKPLARARVSVRVDGREVDVADTNEYGMFSVTFVAPSAGRHKLEVRFSKPGYEMSNKSLEFQVLKREEKKRVGKMAKIVLIIIFVLIFIMILSVFIAKLRT